ncbi:YybS family protein [Bacillus spongiae]|uniref:YybS family protein n=1 Tax=Bacillus spongiae TaxID=2683610 RepID=A0ABU8HGB2_9BACI
MLKTKGITEGAILLSVFAVLLFITLFVPLLGFISSLFLILPFLLYSSKYPLNYSFVLVIASIGLSLFIGSVLSLPIVVTTSIVGVLIGYFVQQGRQKGTILLVASVVTLIITVIEYMIAVVFLEVNIVSELFKTLDEAVEMSYGIVERMGQTPDPKAIESMESMVDLMKALVPSIFVIMSVMSVLIWMLLNFPIMKRFGVNVPKFQPFHKMMLPKSILWYYLITLVISLFISVEPGSYGYFALVNLSFIFQLLLILQGFSFLFYWSYSRGWSKAIPVSLTIFFLIFYPLLFIIRLLGIIDLGFNLRQRLQHK